MAKRKSQKSYAQRRKEYESQYRLLAKEFNKREKEIRKAGKKSRAVNYILSQITSNAISKRGGLLQRLRSRKLADYSKAIKYLSEFMGKESSTLEGVLREEKDRLETIKNKYPELSALSDNEIIEMLQFLGDNRGVNAKQKYDSDQLIIAIGLQKIGDKNKSITDIYEDMQESKKTLADYIRQSLENSKDKEWIEF